MGRSLLVITLTLVALLSAVLLDAPSASAETPPTSVSVAPNNATVDVGTTIAITGVFADVDGWTDLRLGEFLVTTTFFARPLCIVRYDQNLNRLTLWVEGAPWLVAGSPGSGTTVATGDCSLDAAASSTTVVDANTLAVTISTTFTQTMVGTRNLWLRAFDDAGVWGTQDDRGDITITPASSSGPAAPTGLVASPG